VTSIRTERQILAVHAERVPLAPGMARGCATAANAENRLLAQSGPDAAEAVPAKGAPAGSAGDLEAIGLDALIAARQATHGDFARTAAVAQAIKAVLAAAGADRFEPAQREALDMIAAKLARICAGDPTHADHWLDLAGYAWLAGCDVTAR
jgi:hypothetical protein